MCILKEDQSMADSYLDKLEDDLPCVIVKIDRERHFAHKMALFIGADSSVKQTSK